MRAEQLAQTLLSKLGLVILRKKTYEDLSDGYSKSRKNRMLEEFAPSEKIAQFRALEGKSKSQIGQDLMAALVSDFKAGGYFVEFGATDGVTLSNSYLLEKELNWSGILAEPARVWHRSLEVNRTANICKLAVWSSSGQKLLFHEDLELSTIDGFERLKHDLRSGVTYEVETISLDDLLDRHDAPSFIDFMSIDTEGSELEVLSSLDWDKRKFGLICVEHNYTESRNQILDLLTKNGYKRVLEDVSGWDDWYVPQANK